MQLQVSELLLNCPDERIMRLQAKCIEELVVMGRRATQHDRDLSRYIPFAFRFQEGHHLSRAGFTLPLFYYEQQQAVIFPQIEDLVA